MPTRRPRLTRRVFVSALAVLVVLLAGGAFGLYWFQPWALFTNTTVNEPVPSVASPAEPGMHEPGMKGSPRPSSPAAQPPQIAHGGFVSHEHTTSGTARMLRLADGSYVLRLEDLKTSEGPDVRVYLSARNAGAVESGLGGGAIELGHLKGNKGDQNYAVPSGTDLSGLRSAVIWCKRFSVSFGAADLAPAAG